MNGERKSAGRAERTTEAVGWGAIGVMFAKLAAIKWPALATSTAELAAGLAALGTLITGELRDRKGGAFWR